MEALIKKYKKGTTQQLIVKVEKLTGEEKEACIAVLQLRGQDVSRWIAVEVAPEIKKVGSSAVFEADPEEDLTPTEQAQVDKAIATDETASKDETPVEEKAPAKKSASKKSTPKIDSTEPVKRGRSKKDAPAEDSKTKQILDLLRAGELSKYAIAKKVGTYYSVVQGVAKRYFDIEEAAQAGDATSDITDAGIADSTAE